MQMPALELYIKAALCHVASDLGLPAQVFESAVGNPRSSSAMAMSPAVNHIGNFAHRQPDRRAERLRLLHMKS